MAGRSECRILPLRAPTTKGTLHFKQSNEPTRQQSKQQLHQLTSPMKKGNQRTEQATWLAGLIWRQREAHQTTAGGICLCPAWAPNKLQGPAQDLRTTKEGHDEAPSPLPFPCTKSSSLPKLGSSRLPTTTHTYALRRNKDYISTYLLSVSRPNQLEGKQTKQLKNSLVNT